MPIWREKFDGFFGLRADIKFRLQINAQPFQLGRLMLVWVPYKSYLGNYGDLYDEESESAMVSLSGCPRVDIDLSTSTECDITIPYVSPHSHFNLATGEGMWGKLYIKVYSPLGDVAGTGHVDCTSWINLTNIDLAFPTGANTVTTSVIPSSDVIRAQVGSEEIKMETHRSIAQDVGKLSTFLKPLNQIPLLSQLSAPTTWALDNFSSFLKFCGYSKLQSTNVPSFLKQTPTHFMPNYDGVDMSHGLGFASDNAIELMPEMVGNDVDEMSLKHIVSTPCYFNHFEWKAAAKAGDLLWEQTINPANFVCTDGNTLTFVPTHLSYTSAVFQYWRGSIDITFKFVKTKFHSGRVRIFFQPGTAWAGVALRKDYNYSQIVDLRSQTEIVFRVPYVATHPWLHVSQTGASPSGLYSTIGVVHVEVLNELVSTSAVQANIDVLCEVSAGPDYELACPTNVMFRPYVKDGSIAPPPKPDSASTRKARSIGADILNRIVAQIGDAEPQEEEQSIVNKDQLGTDPLRMSWFNNLSTIGEKVLSVRQLIKRANIVAKISKPTVPTTRTIAPYMLKYGADSSETEEATLMSYLDYFAHIYAFRRGAVNIKILSPTTGLVYVAFRVNGDHDSTYPAALVSDTGVAEDRLMTTWQPIYTNLEGSIDLHVPYYSAYHMCPVTNLKYSNVNDALGVHPDGLISVVGLTEEAAVFRNAADSFQYGYLIGPPRCAQKTS